MQRGVTMDVGIAGIGRMGAAMAARLMERGHTLTLWNRTRDKLAPLAAAGAACAADPAELAERTATIITVLSDRAALESVYEGPRGLLAGAQGRLFIDMSTVAPETAMALAERVRAGGGRFLECPVGGTVGPARAGTLLGVAGGVPADFAAAKPLLSELCRRVEHVGAVGAGSSLKLALNLPLMIYYQALGESYVLCRHLGLDPQWLIAFLSDTSGGTNILRSRGSAIATMLAGGDAGPPSFALDLMRKDLALMVAEGKKRGAPLPLTENTLRICDAAAEYGWGGRDGACLAAYWPARHPRMER
jgi:3-hydroxyisobutyrate dehydrogenase